ncbi:MAG TPA: putative oxidoreductase C-terminal domain-containing protein [Bacteroidales bacterium]|nr:putative oxidoreductase C-terminal domain-containing protein [Bacteroidales bacterium]
MEKLLSIILTVTLVLSSCGTSGSKDQSGKSDAEMENNSQVKLLTVDPGHFHAALVQKIMYEQVSPDVHVYAPEGPDYLQYLASIKSYNSREIDPTSWNEIVYTGSDFFEKMASDSAGNVVVLSGNNRKKAEYITKSINAGLNVLADKPMIITPEDFPSLEAAFATAKEKGILLYDIMTERYEVTTILQKLLSHKTEVFGNLTIGSKDEPAVTKVSVHHFSKIVSGKPLTRPAWFFDVQQQGEGIVDVTTHLVDLIQWECFPEQILNTSDITMVEAKRWPTLISQDEFKGVTGIDNFPDFLQKDVKDGKLNVFANGEMVYQIKGVFAKVSVEWRYKAPAGGGDTHYSVMHGTQCDIVIKQGPEEKFLPTLYIDNVKGITMNQFSAKLQAALGTLPYDSLTIEAVNKNSLKINIPDKYRVTHEDHFGQVTAKFLEYMKEGKLPEWEVPNMITKYYTTTSALKMASR